MAARFAEQLCAAMPANIMEGANSPFVVAHGEDGITRDRAGHVVARLPQPPRPGKQHPVLRENLPPLALEKSWIAIVFGRQRPIEVAGGRLNHRRASSRMENGPTC